MESLLQVHRDNSDNSDMDLSRKGHVRFSLTPKPASFDNCDSNISNTLSPISNIYLIAPMCNNRRYSDTSISKIYEQNPFPSLHNSEINCRKRYVPRQYSVNKPPALDEISIDIMKANCSLGGFKQLQKVQNIKKETQSQIINDKIDNYALSRIEILRNSDDAQLVSSTKESHPRNYIGIKSQSNGQIRFRLGYRKKLQERRRQISDYSFISAVFGIIIMVLMTELQWAGVFEKNSTPIYFMKTLITVSTVILVAFILIYHILVIKLLSCDDCLEDWRISITWQMCLQMILEVIICSIHPPPFFFDIDIHLTVLDSSHQNLYIKDPLPLDLALSLPMFLRFYLVFRVILLHSRLFSDAGLRSIGAINKVKFDSRFIMKTLLTICPATVFILFVLSMWIFFSWILRACEIRVDSRHNSLLNSTWLIAVTFLCVGYGEMVPHTTCGKGIAILSGVMGSACTALIVAVLAKKLELSKAEQHVFHFMMDNKIKTKLKHCAANVLRETWLIYKFTKLVQSVDLSRIRTHQRKFLKAIHGLRRNKIDQRKLRDNSNTLVDLAKTIQTGLLRQPTAYISQPVEIYRETQNTIYESVTEMREEYSGFHKRIEQIESSLLEIQRCLNCFPNEVQRTLQIS